MIHHINAAAPEAIITRRPLDRENCYLVLDPKGSCTWTKDPVSATPFPSMREAARMALRLPAAFKAYGLPRSVELDIATAH
jgi:hypothetical protein